MRRTLLSCVAIVAAIGLSTSSPAQAPKTRESTARLRQAPAPQISTGSRYIVQLGTSFKTAEKANELMLQLRRKYPNAHTQRPSSSETLYRVRIGPYDTREDAQQVADELASQGFQGVTIFPWGLPPQKPSSEPLQRLDSPQVNESDEAMRRTLNNLSTQIGALAGELQMMRRETERNSAMMELLLNEDRLSKLEDKIQDAADRKAQLDAREQEIARRSRNIQGELVLRGGLRRDEAEAAIRAELQRALDDAHSQQAVYQQRLAELNEQAARFRARVETLRKKLELLDAKSDKQEK